MQGMRICFRVTVCFCLLVAGLQPLSAQVNVTTWHNDSLRTGDNLNETTLTPGTSGSVATQNFGQLCAVSLDAPVYSQPLVYTGRTINRQYYAYVVYVVTQKGTVYAINGTPPSSGGCTIITYTSLVPSGQYPADCSKLGNGDGSACINTIYPSVGILGTPVIGNWTAPTPELALYAVTETQDCQLPCNANYYHYLHAVDIQRGLAQP